MSRRGKPSGASAALKELVQSVECPLCAEPFKKPHSFSTCGCTFCYDCVIDTLEGPGISKSQCPKCHQPGWKKDLVFNHQLNNVVDTTMKLQAAATAGTQRVGLRQRMLKLQSAGAGGLPSKISPAATESAPIPSAAAPQSGERQATGKRQRAAEGSGVAAARSASAQPAPVQQRQQQQQDQPANSGKRSAAAAAQPAKDSKTSIQQQQQQQQQECRSSDAMERQVQPDGPLEGQLDPTTPEFFGEAWVQRVRLLPTPSPRLVEQLMLEVARLDEAIRLCDQLPCRSTQHQQQQQQQQQQHGEEQHGEPPRHAAAAVSRPEGLLSSPCSPAAPMAGASHAEVAPPAAAAAWVRVQEGAALNVVPDSEDLWVPLPPQQQPGAASGAAAWEQRHGGQSRELAGEPAPALGAEPSSSGAAQQRGSGQAWLEAQASDEEQEENLRVSGARKRRRLPSGRAIPSRVPAVQPPLSAQLGAVEATAADRTGQLGRLSAEGLPPSVAGPSGALNSRSAQHAQQQLMAAAAPLVPLAKPSSAAVAPCVVPNSDSEPEDGDEDFLRPPPQSKQALAATGSRARGSSGKAVTAGAGATARPQAAAAGQPAAAAAAAEAPWQYAGAMRRPGLGARRKAERQLEQAEQFVDALSNRQPKQQQPGPVHQEQQDQQHEQQQEQQQEPAEQHKQQGQEQRKPPGQQDGGVTLGSLVRVLWEQGKFTGRVTKYNPDTGEHFIEYHDGDRQWHHLSKEEWSLINSQDDPYCFQPTPSESSSDAEPGDCGSGSGGSSSSSEGGSDEECSSGDATSPPACKVQFARRGTRKTNRSRESQQRPAGGGRARAQAKPLQLRPRARVLSSSSSDEEEQPAGRAARPPRPQQLQRRSSEQEQPDAVGAAADRATEAGLAAGAAVGAIPQCPPSPGGQADAEQPAAEGDSDAGAAASDGAAPAAALGMAAGPAAQAMQFGTQDVAGLLVGLSSGSRSLPVGGCQPEAPPSVSTRAGSLPPAQHPGIQQQQQQQEQGRQQQGRQEQGRQPSPLGRPSPSAVPGASEGPGRSTPSTLQATSRHNVELPSGSLSARQAAQAASAAAGLSRSAGCGEQESGGGSAQSCEQQEQQEQQDTPAPGPPPQCQAPALQMAEQATSGSVGGQNSQGQQRQGSVGQQQQQQEQEQEQEQERPTTAHMQHMLQRSVGSSARAANSSTRGGGKPGGGRGSSSSAAPPRKMRSVLDLFAAADGQGSSESMRTARRTAPSAQGAAAAAAAAGPKVLVLSSTRGEQESLVLKCVEKLGRARIDQTVTETTTHVLVPTDEYGKCTTRTMKYMLGVVRGAWVVSYAWADACIDAGAWIPEKNFEAKGDLEGYSAPMKSRCERSSGKEGLFKGITLYVHDHNNKIFVDFMRLLRFAGAKVLTRLPAAQDLAGVRLIVPGSNNASAAKDLKARTGAKQILRWEWVFDSISHWKVLSPKAKHIWSVK